MGLLLGEAAMPFSFCLPTYKGSTLKENKLCFFFKGLKFRKGFCTLWMDGWMICDFTSFSTVFQSYQDDGRMIMKGCVPTEQPGLLFHGSKQEVAGKHGGAN